MPPYASVTDIIIHSRLIAALARLGQFDQERITKLEADVRTITAAHNALVDTHNELVDECQRMLERIYVLESRNN